MVVVGEGRVWRSELIWKSEGREDDWTGLGKVSPNRLDQQLTLIVLRGQRG